MDYRATIIVSCWLSIAVISSVYMFVFGDRLSDIMFGVLLPIGLLVLVAIAVTFGIATSYAPERKQEAKPSVDSQGIRSRLDAISKEIEKIKKETSE